jgi:hypothetical protein
MLQNILWGLIWTSISLGLGFLALIRWLRLKNLGTLEHITTGSVAYDELSFGHILNWDKHCFYMFVFVGLVKSRQASLVIER